MNNMVDHKKQFITVFNETARYHHRQRVFRDFITLASAAIHNNILFDETLEQEYMETVRHYEANDAERMASLLAEVVMGLNAGGGDFLGELYMQLELGEAGRGQFFTPFSISRMMAEMQLGDIDKISGREAFCDGLRACLWFRRHAIGYHRRSERERIQPGQVCLGLLHGYRSCRIGHGLYSALTDGYCR